MGKIPADLGECCEILGVSPKAGREEIKLAFALNRRELEMAGYNVEAVRRLVEAAEEDGPLSYDDPPPGMSAAPHAFPGKVHRSSLSSVTLLGAISVVLLVIVFFLIWPRYGYKLRSFDANDSLVEAKTGEPYATVVEVHKAHKFANGKVAPAYRLKLVGDGGEVWYPVNDVHYLCVRE